MNRRPAYLILVLRLSIGVGAYLQTKFWVLGT